MEKTLSILNVAILFSLIYVHVAQCLPANQQQDEGETTQLVTTARAFPAAARRTTPPAPGCGGYYLAPSGFITSQNYPNSYKDHSDCVWYIKTQAGASINFKFIDFDVEYAENCQYDYVALYASSNYGSSFLATFCGNSLPASIKSPSNELIVHMRTDSKVTGKGFKASYTSVCPPGFTFYGASSKCYAVINNPMNKDGHIAQCSRLAVGAFIAAPLNAEENQFIQSLIKSQDTTERAKCKIKNNDNSYDGYYLGAECWERRLCKTFQWHISGGYRQKMEYAPFYKDMPDCDKDEFCLHYYFNFEWNDIPCNFIQCSVCEYRLLK